jgi:nucleoside-diphosphate-sugar epimerase
MTVVSIVGLGWLGKSLAKALVLKGYSVKGSSTTAEKADLLIEDGIKAKQFYLNPYPEGPGFLDLFDTDILFVNIPPKTRSMPPAFYPEQMKFLKEMILQNKIKKVIYVSSTSVYPDKNQIADEADVINIENTGNVPLYNAEQLLWNDRTFDLTIIRFGGLLGVDRVPGRYFSAKNDVVGDTPVNYIHREDAINMVIWIIEKGLWNQIFNGVAPIHPKRREVYEKNAADLGFPPPKSYALKGSSWKEISADKILRTGFEFKIPNPLEFSYDIE